MNRSTVFVLTILATALSSPAAPAPAAATAPHGGAAKSPNILFVLIDDMGYRDLSCFGGTRVTTPQIDRLAAEGIRFTQFYVSAPICSPSRVALTTGQYPNRWSITSYLARRDEDARRGQADWLDPAAPSVARMLQAAGYHTAHVGKWHMGGQRDVADAPPITAYGFDTSVTNFEGLGPRILSKFESINHGPTDMSAKFGGPGVEWVDRHEVTAAFVDRAIGEMSAAQKSDSPFYINLWLDDVHSPMQAPPDPPELRGDGSPVQQYLGVMKEMDRQLGRLFDHIRANENLRHNTLILLCSDNGHEPGLGSPGELRGHKGSLYEGGIRSPLIVWFPPRTPTAAASGTVNETTVLAGIDFAPSVLAIAGVAPPADVKFDGLDMSDVMLARAGSEAKERPRREGAVMWVRPPDRPGPKESWPDLAIRDGHWKLLVDRDRSQPELFHIYNDPSESKNLAEANPQVVQRLSAQVIAWDKQTTQARPPKKVQSNAS